MAIPGTTTPHVGSNRICQGQQTGVAHISSGAGVTGGEVTHSVEEVLPTPIKKKIEVNNYYKVMMWKS